MWIPVAWNTKDVKRLLSVAGIQIIGNNFIRGPTIQGLVQCDSEFQKLHGLRRVQSVGLLYDARTSCLVTNGRPGQLQFFSVDTGSQLLSVCIWQLFL